MIKSKVLSINIDSISIETFLPEIIKRIKEVQKVLVSGNIDEKMFDSLLKDIATHYHHSINQIIPSWAKMCAVKSGETELHVMRSLVSLCMIEEYKNTSKKQQNAMEWVMLLHDLAKIPRQKKDDFWERDAMHPFRSAAIAARILPQLGFTTTKNYLDEIENWVDLVNNASIPDIRDGFEGETIQENSNLKTILTGLDELFGANSLSSKMIKSILLHQSIPMVDDWPAASPLSDDEIASFFNNELLEFMSPILKADSDAWQLFTDNRKNYADQVQRNIDRIRSLF